MINLPRTFYDRIEILFPYPLARSMVDIRETSASLDKFNRFFSFVEIIIKYCSFIALCDYFSDQKREKSLDCEIRNFFSSEGDFPSWFNLLKTILKNWQNRVEESFSPELYYFIFDEKGRPTDNYERLEQILNIYNKFEGKICDSGKQASFYFEKLEVLIIEFLEELSFIVHYPLIKPVMVKPFDDRYIINANTYISWEPDFKYSRINAAKPFVVDRMQILKPEINEILELYPFLLSHRCLVCQKNHLFVFQHIEDNSLKYACPFEHHELYLSLKYLFPSDQYRIYDSSEDTGEILSSVSLDLRKKNDYEDIWHEFRFNLNMDLDFSEKYKLLELVGTGGMGEVYKSLQTNLGSLRAIKILPGSLSGNVKSIKRFEREAKLTARLEHENIVRVIDVGKYDLERFIVMEYIEGETLRDILIDRKTLPEEEVVNLTIGIASGLNWIHENDIIHRDIKPENIMIDIGGKVKITDFGISKSTISASLTAVGMPLGTAQYFSPEQAGVGEIKFYSDIYSLGVVIYEMLTGSFPYEFKDDNPIAIAYTIVNTPPEPVTKKASAVSPDFEAIVMKCLEKDSTKRFSNAGELLQALQSLQDKKDKMEYSIYETTKIRGNLGFKLFLEGLMWSGKMIDGAQDLIEDRRVALGISEDDAGRLLEEVKRDFKARESKKDHSTVDLNIDEKEIKIEESSLKKQGIAELEITQLQKTETSEKKLSTKPEEEYSRVVERYFEKGYRTVGERDLLESIARDLNISPELSRKIFLEIRKRHEGKPEEDEDQYRNLVRHFISKGYITDEEERKLFSLKERLKLSEEQISRVRAEIEDIYRGKIARTKGVEQEYRQALAGFYEKGFVNDADLQLLKDLNKNLGLSEYQIKRIFAEVEANYKRKIEETKIKLEQDKKEERRRRDLEIQKERERIEEERLRRDQEIQQEKEKIEEERRKREKERLDEEREKKEKARKESEIRRNQEKEVRTYLNKGDKCYARKDYEGAVVQYGKAALISPNFVSVHTSLGNAYYCLGQYKQAIKEYEKALELEPDSSIARSNLSHLYKTLEEKKILKPDSAEGDRITLALKQYSDLYERHMKKGYLTVEEQSRFQKFRSQHKLPENMVRKIEEEFKKKSSPRLTESKDKPAEDITSVTSPPESKDKPVEGSTSIPLFPIHRILEEEQFVPVKLEEQPLEKGDKTDTKDKQIKGPLKRMGAASQEFKFLEAKKTSGELLRPRFSEESRSPVERFTGQDLDNYRGLLEDYWIKGYLSDNDLKDLEQKKEELRLPEELTEKIAKEVEDKVKARERSRLDIIDMAVTNYRTFLENIWKKGYLTEDEDKLVASQRDEYRLPEDVAHQIEKEVEINITIKEKKRLKKALTDYQELLEKLWMKGFLSEKDSEVLRDYKIKNRLPQREISEINRKFEKEYRLRTEQKNVKNDKVIEENLSDRLSVRPPVGNDGTKYTTFVSREKELEELLSYYMYFDDAGQDMVKWALINTFKSLREQLHQGKKDWATPSFLKTLRRARVLMPEDKKELIELLDAILKEFPSEKSET